jgi:hypothetical protein
MRHWHTKLHKVDRSFLMHFWDGQNVGKSFKSFMVAQQKFPFLDDHLHMILHVLGFPRTQIRQPPNFKRTTSN